MDRNYTTPKKWLMYPISIPHSINLHLSSHRSGTLHRNMPGSYSIKQPNLCQKSQILHFCNSGNKCSSRFTKIFWAQIRDWQKWCRYWWCVWVYWIKKRQSICYCLHIMGQTCVYCSSSLCFDGLFQSQNSDLLQKKQVCNPSLNTQSCIKGLLVAKNFCFWVVWAARTVLKKKYNE